jgi:hypothetical protein
MMKLQLDTAVRQAFDSYSEAVSLLEEYRQSGEKAFVTRAEGVLGKAREADPHWIRPIYLRSILNDLSGNSQAAIDTLLPFRDLPDSSFAFEVKYNLGVAYYHRYSERFLNEAEPLFQYVHSRGPKPLGLLAAASLAQVYGLRILLKEPERRAELKPAARKHMTGAQLKPTTFFVI